MELRSKRANISFCTVCMNRLHQLRITLPKNIQDNSDYPEANFALLDYGSTDGLDMWVKDTMDHHLRSGKLIYFRFDGASSFHRCHSRNLAFRVAPGEVICNVDADNYTGHGFAQYINEQFARDKSIFLTTIDLFRKNKNYHVPKDVMGRVCVEKNVFLQIHGYDERMVNYGFEDYDLANRLEMFGMKRVLIEGNDFLKHISHGDEERYSFDIRQNTIRSLYVSYKKPWQSIILILLQNQTFRMATVIDQAIIDAYDARYAYLKRMIHFQYHLKEKSWHKGIWRLGNDAKMHLRFEDGTQRDLKVLDDKIIEQEGKNTFYLVRDESLINWMTIFHTVMNNRLIMEQNLQQKTIRVNNERFGEGKVVRNFQSI